MKATLARPFCSAVSGVTFSSPRMELGPLPYLVFFPCLRSVDLLSPKRAPLFLLKHVASVSRLTLFSSPKLILRSSQMPCALPAFWNSLAMCRADFACISCFLLTINDLGEVAVRSLRFLICKVELQFMLQRDVVRGDYTK